MAGSYVVTTNPKGETEMTMKVNVHNPKKFNTKGTFGLGWGFEFKEGAMKTETYHALWDYDGIFGKHSWTTSMHTFNRPLKGSMSELVRKKQINEKEKARWTPVVNRMVSNSHILAVARRQFKQESDSKSFKLGSKV